MQPTDPETLFAAWAEAAEAGTAPDLEALIREHPQHEDALRAMHADWQLFAPILERVVPGLIASDLGLGPGPLSNDADASQQPASPQLIERLGIRLPDAGRYRFRGVLGRGGGGVVLRVWDQKLHRPLAMKVVLWRGEAQPGGDTPPVDAALMTRFVDEARIASQLDHPGIVPVHELGTDATGRAFFTMRLVKGDDLSKILAKVRDGSDGWTQVRALGVLAKVCEAVAYAHEKGVVHRDLKPANVMVGRHGEVHVMDWGLARVRGTALATGQPAARTHDSRIDSLRAGERDATPDSPLLTRAGSVVGTPAYMSPEQARGELHHVDTRSDVYAIGAMLYELLTGHPPFVPPGAVVKAGLILMRVLEGPPTPIERSAAKAPPELVAICERAMAREPEQRYPDVRALESDVSAFLERRVVRAYATGTWAETKKWAQRNAGLAAALGGILLAAAIGAAAFASQANVAQQARRDAERSAAEARGMTYVASMLGAGSAHRAGERTNVLRMLDAAPKELRGWEWHYLAALSDTRLCVMRGHTEQIRSIELSPDATKVVTASVDGTARVWDASTGEQLLVLDHESQVFEAVFTQDGRYIVTHTLYDVFRRWDATTGEPLVIVGDATGDDMWPSGCMSRYGRTAVGYSADGTTTVWSTETGEVLMRLPGHSSVAAISSDGSRLPSWSDGGPVELWNTDTGRTLAPVLEGSAVEGCILRFSDDSRRLARWSPQDPSMRIWDAHAARPITDLGVVDAVRDCSFSPRGDRLAVLTSRGVLVFDAQTAAEVYRHESESGCDEAVFRPDGTAVLLRNGDSAFLIELPSGTCAHHLMDFGSWNAKRWGGRLLFSPDGTRILQSGSGWLWDGATGDALSQLDPDGNFWGSFSTDGTRIVGFKLDATAGVWDGRVGFDLRNCGAAHRIRDVAFSSDGSRAVTLADRALQVWETATCRELARHDFEGSSPTLGYVSLSPDERQVLVPMTDDVCILNASTGKEQGHLADCGGLTAFSCNRNGSAIMTMQKDGTCRIWNTQIGRYSAGWSAHNHVSCAFWSPDCRWIVTAEDADLLLRNVETGEVEQRLSGHSDRIESAFVCPDGATIISRSSNQAIAWRADGSRKEVETDDSVVLALRFHGDAGFAITLLGYRDDRMLTGGNRLEVRDATTWRVLVTLEGHSNKIVAAAMTSDGQRIATAADDKTVRIWNAASGQELLRLDADGVSSVMFSPDDRWLCVQGNGEVRLYDSVPRRVTQMKREGLVGR